MTPLSSLLQPLLCFAFFFLSAKENAGREQKNQARRRNEWWKWWYNPLCNMNSFFYCILHTFRGDILSFICVYVCVFVIFFVSLPLSLTQFFALHSLWNSAHFSKHLNVIRLKDDSFLWITENSNKTKKKKIMANCLRYAWWALINRNGVALDVRISW